MRKPGLVFLAVSFLAASGFAQQKNELSVFLSDPSIFYTSSDGTKATSGYGIALDRMLAPTVSVQLAVASERAKTYSYIVNPTGTFAPVPPVSFHVYPIDLTVRYHFVNDTRWKPFIGAGAHYVGAPNVPPEFRYKNHLGPLLVGGTSFRITRSFGIVLEGKAVVGDREQYDRPLRSVVGFDWRF